VTDIPNLSAAPSPSAATPTSGIGVDTSRLTSRANLEKAGKQFEAVFSGMMLKSMRDAKLADDDLFGSKAGDTFREMQDQKLSQSMAEHAPLGIGKAMTEFLAKGQAALQATTASGTAADGGAATP
jgi:flagellar protein FlgJ